MNVLVTGASGDIGQAIVDQLAAEHQLILHYHANVAAIAQLQARHGETIIQTIQADLTTKHGVESLLSQLAFPVDAIIFNAGVSQYELFTDTSEATMEAMLFVHLYGPMLIAKRLLPSMIRQQRGHIIFISSIWGQIGAACEVVYSTVKGGQLAFVKALAKEVAPSRVRVNAVAPGAVDTKMLNVYSSAEKQALIDDIPLGRLATPLDIAQTIEFLVSDKSAYMTGQTLAVNGGWHV